MKSITKKQISAMGFQRAYRRAYRAGRKKALKDLKIFMIGVIPPHNTLSLEIGQFSNFTEEMKEIIVIDSPKI